MKRLQELLNARGANLTTDGIFGAKSLAALNAYITAEFAKRGWKLAPNGLVWLRTDMTLSNTFDDFVAVYKGGVCIMAAPCSTTAGDTYIFNPITHLGVTGTAIACEQQVLKSHRFVTSRTWGNLWTGSPYFQQVLPIKIWRDGNKDRALDKKVPQIGLFGINFHRGWLGRLINNASAGCQVVPDGQWFEIVKHFSAGQEVDFNLIEM